MIDIINKIVSTYRRNKLYGSFGAIGSNCNIIAPDILSFPQKIEIGSYTTVLDHARIQSYSYLTGIDSKICIGSHCYLGYYLSILAGADVIIHDGVLMASNILISSESHGVNLEDDKYYMDQPLICKSVEIGEGCWIGEKATILGGVKIGAKCVIGANSVVTHDVPDYSIAVGNPARVIKKWNFEKHEWKKVD